MSGGLDPRSAAAFTVTLNKGGLAMRRWNCFFALAVMLVFTGCATMVTPNVTMAPGDDPSWAAYCQNRAVVQYGSGGDALGGAAGGAALGALGGGLAGGWRGSGMGAGIGAGVGLLFGLIGEAYKSSQAQNYSQALYESCMNEMRRSRQQYTPPPPPPGYQPPPPGYPPSPAPPGRR